MKKILTVVAVGAALAAVAAPPNPHKAAMKQQKAQMHMAHQQQKAQMHAIHQQQKAQAHAIHQQQRAQAHAIHQQQRILRAGGRAAMRGPRFANGYHVPPRDFVGWYRGPHPHPHYRNIWFDDIWYDAYGYPCYSPAYQEVVMMPAGAVIYQPGAVVAPAQTVVVQQPAVVTPTVVAPPPAVVVPQPTVVAPPPPPPTKTERVLNAIFGP